MIGTVTPPKTRRLGESYEAPSMTDRSLAPRVRTDIA